MKLHVICASFKQHPHMSKKPKVGTKTWANNINKATEKKNRDLTKK